MIKQFLALIVIGILASIQHSTPGHILYSDGRSDVLVGGVYQTGCIVNAPCDGVEGGRVEWEESGNYTFYAPNGEVVESGLYFEVLFGDPVFFEDGSYRYTLPDKVVEGCVNVAPCGEDRPGEFTWYADGSWDHVYPDGEKDIGNIFRNLE